MMGVDEFIAAWDQFVQSWLQAGGATSVAAQKLVEQALATGLPPAPVPATESSDDPDDDSDPDDPDEETVRRKHDHVACAMAVIDTAGEFDAAAYRHAHAADKFIRKEPLKRFCADGWERTLNPRPGFDTWWYWAEHLDPARAEINPLLHYCLEGRRAGLPTSPPVVELRTPSTLPTDREIRRAILFAAYDIDDVIDPYVIDYVTELARHGDVFYLSDGHMSDAELSKLNGITRGAWSFQHGLYDFGSWSTLARKLVGWKALDSYDEVVFANDSTFLLKPLDDLFEHMNTTACDWWGLHPTKRNFTRDHGDTEKIPLAEAKERFTYVHEMEPLDQLHMSSYILGFRRPVLDDPGFRRRIDSVARQKDKANVILKYEVGVSHYLMTKGFDFASLIDDLYPFLPAYSSDVWDVMRQGFPLIKRNLISDNPRHTPGLKEWKERVTECFPEATVDLFERNLQRVTPDDHRHLSFGITVRGDGSVAYHDTLMWPQFKAEDAWAPKFDHWWVFVVARETGQLSLGTRAIFDQVRHDPSIKKILLTRSETIELSGANVETAPVMSRQGQHYLMRARHIITATAGKGNYHWPLDTAAHHIIAVDVDRSINPFAATGHQPPRDATALKNFKKARRQQAINHRAVTAVLAPGPLDALQMSGVMWPTTDAIQWRIGMPRHDYLFGPEAHLPQDLQAAVNRVRDEVGDRKLLLYLPKDTDEVKKGHRLAALATELGPWLAANNVVLGVRDPGVGRSHAVLRYLEKLGLAPLDLAARDHPSVDMLVRAADALISDRHSLVLDFLLADKPLAMWPPPRPSKKVRDRRLSFATVLPVAYCESTDAVFRRLDGLLSGEQAAHIVEANTWSRDLFRDTPDGGAAARAVSKIKDLYVASPSTIGN